MIFRRCDNPNCRKEIPYDPDERDYFETIIIDGTPCELCSDCYKEYSEKLIKFQEEFFSESEVKITKKTSTTKRKTTRAKTSRKTKTSIEKDDSIEEAATKILALA